MEVRTSPIHSSRPQESSPIDLSMSATATPHPQLSTSAAAALTALYPAVSDEVASINESAAGMTAATLGNTSLRSLIAGDEQAIASVNTTQDSGESSSGVNGMKCCC